MFIGVGCSNQSTSNSSDASNTGATSQSASTNGTEANKETVTLIWQTFNLYSGTKPGFQDDPVMKEIEKNSISNLI